MAVAADPHLFNLTGSINFHINELKCLRYGKKKKPKQTIFRDLEENLVKMHITDYMNNITFSSRPTKLPVEPCKSLSREKVRPKS